MIYDSKKNTFKVSRRAAAFTLIEVMVAIVILSLIVSSVLTTMNRCVSATIDSRKQMLAFELARENMETLLAATSMKEQDEFGVSELDPEIEWETIVEPTSVSGSDDWFLQAICSATYIDTEGESQKIEFTHWLTKLTDQDIKKIEDREGMELDQLDRIEYDKFLRFIRKKILSFLVKNNYDTYEYEDFLKELNEEKKRFIEEAKKEKVFDDEKYDEFIDDQEKKARKFLVPDYFTSEEYDILWEIAEKIFEEERSARPSDSSAKDNDNDTDKVKEPDTPEKEFPDWWYDLDPEKRKIFGSFLD